MKRLMVATLSASLLLPALAQANDNITVSQPISTPQTDLSAVFSASGDDLQIVALSDKEMEETEGAWVPQAIGAIGGAGIATWGYMGNASTTGNFSWKGLAVTASVGAIGGAISPVGTLGRYYTISRITGVGGAVTGIVK